MATIIEKTLRFDQLKYQDGEVTLWGHSCFIDPIIGTLVKNKIIGQLTNPELVPKINYFSEKFQAFMGVKITGEKFGYAKTYKDKKDLLTFSGGQFELLGYGKVEWVKMDFDSELFIVKMSCPYAKLYKETIGMSKTSVDHWNAGGWAGCLEYILGKKTACIETSCIAKGQPSCEFVIKPLDKWDKKDPLVKENSYVFEDIAPDLGKVRL